MSLYVRPLALLIYALWMLNALTSRHTPYSGPHAVHTRAAARTHAPPARHLNRHLPCPALPPRAFGRLCQRRARVRVRLRWDHDRASPLAPVPAVSFYPDGWASLELRRVEHRSGEEGVRGMARGSGLACRT